MRTQPLQGFLAILTLIVACTSKPRADVAPAAALPTISSVTPTSGPAGAAYPVELTISGKNFADSTNVVTFGPVTITSVRSTNGGTRIVVQAPKAMPSTGEVPPMPLMTGEYTVRVATTAGVSNPVTFNLTREP
jgi:Rieske Fe-S protein